MLIGSYVSKFIKLRYVKSFCKYCTESRQSNYNVFMDCFGFSHDESYSFIKQHKLYNKDTEHLLQVIECCRQLGFSDEALIANPSLFKIKKMVIEQRYLIMEEGGFQKVTPFLIAKYRLTYSKSIRALKTEKLIHPSTDVVQSFVSYLNPHPENLKVEKSSEFDLWSMVQRKVITAYLKWRLEASTEDIERLLRIHKLINYKCMRFLCENISTALNLGYTPKQILKFGYLLHCYPKYSQEVLRDLPNIAGADMRRAMRLYPKLVTVSPKNFIKIYGILKEFNVSDEAIRKQMNVFQVSPDTVRVRLNEISRIPEFQVLVNNPRILSLVVHHNRAKSRLSFLQKLQLKCASTFVLGGSESRFDNHIKDGKDINSIKDILIFLKDIFDEDLREMKEKWKKHPFSMHVPLSRMQETYSYLKKKRFHSHSIYKVIHILLYPRDKIATAFECINNEEPMKGNKLSEVQRLNLVLYYMEKDHHFTGNGIWTEADGVNVDTTKLTE